MKLLPYYDIDLTLKKSEGPKSNDAHYLRRLLTISRSDAEMISKQKGIKTLHELMNYYFDSLLVPEASPALVEDIVPCFFGQRDRAQVFVSTLHRLVWEYNFVNQTFV